MSTIADHHIVAPARPSASGAGKAGVSGELTRAELEALAEATARELLGVSAEDAFAKLESGELEGTLAGGTLGSLHWLLSAA